MIPKGVNMKKGMYSLRTRPLLVLIGLLLFELSFNTLVFAANIVDKTTTTKITHGPSIQTTTEGIEVIDSANGTIID